MCDCSLGVYRRLTTAHTITHTVPLTPLHTLCPACALIPVPWSLLQVSDVSLFQTVYLTGGTDGTENFGDLWLLKGEGKGGGPNQSPTHLFTHSLTHDFSLITHHSSCTHSSLFERLLLFTPIHAVERMPRVCASGGGAG